MKNENPIISVVIPCYGSPQSLNELVTRISETCSNLPDVCENYEIILVNDNCPSGSWSVIKELCQCNQNVSGLSLSRNFGQHYAIVAGLDKCAGNWVVVMDGDLQDRPEEIENLYIRAQEGFDIVFAAREIRSDSFFKKLGSKAFYWLLSYATDTQQDSRIANFGIYKRNVVDAILQFRENLRFFPANVKWVGFTSTELIVQHSERAEGKSSYKLGTLIKLATDVLFGFSDKPMKLLVSLGALVATLSFLSGILVVGRYFYNGVAVQGWASIMVSLWFMFGALMMSVGIVGAYAARAFAEAKNRPLYIIDEYVSSSRKKPVDGN